MTISVSSIDFLFSSIPPTPRLKTPACTALAAPCFFIGETLFCEDSCVLPPAVVEQPRILPHSISNVPFHRLGQKLTYPTFFIFWINPAETRKRGAAFGSLLSSVRRLRIDTHQFPRPLATLFTSLCNSHRLFQTLTAAKQKHTSQIPGQDTYTSSLDHHSSKPLP